MNSLPSESSWHLQHLWVAVSDRSHVGPVARNPKSANRLFETCPAARITVRGRGLPSGGFSARLPVSPFESRCPTPSGDASESTPHGLDLVTSVVRLGSVFATSARSRAKTCRARWDAWTNPPGSRSTMAMNSAPKIRS